MVERKGPDHRFHKGCAPVSDRIQYIYLVSTPYSGSTLMAVLLNSHPQIASIGELANSIGALFDRGKIDQNYCACGVEIRECPLWRQVQTYCADRGFELDLHDFGTRFASGMGPTADRVLFGSAAGLISVQIAPTDLLWQVPAYRRRISQTMQQSAIVAEAVLHVTGKQVFLDSSKSVGRASLLARRGELDFKVIHLARDPRGFVSSGVRHAASDATTAKHSRTWAGVHRAALGLRSYLPDDAYILVRYEDVCTRSTETFAKLSAFLGVQAVDLLTEVSNTPRHIIGNEMRMRPFAGLRLDERWREDLGPQEIRECMRITGGVSRALGYR